MKKFSLILGLLAILACSDSNESFLNSPPAPPIAGEVMEEADMMIESGDNDDTSSEINEPQKIIKTANLAFETQNLDKTYKQIITLVAQQKGIIQSDNAGKDYGRFYKNLVIRIPAENFDVTLNGISTGVAYFDRRQITQKDVTEEFVDIEARLRAKKELENRYLALLKQAKNVKEMLEIERELSNIREEIEAREGRLKYLSSQVAMSTIYLKFYKSNVETGVTVSYGQKIKNALKSGWQGISAFFLGLLTIWPFLILLVIIIFIVRRFIKRKRK